MSDQDDGKGRAENIDVIRDLLRKLEEVATTDGERQAALPPAAEPRADLSSLQRSMVQRPRAQADVDERPGAHPLPEIGPRPSTDVVKIDMRAGTMLETVPQHRRQGSGFRLAALSFGLGIACAIGIIFAFDPLKQIYSAPRQAEQAVPAAPPVEIAAPAATPPAAVEPAPANAGTAVAAAPTRSEALPQAERRLALPVEPPPIPQVEAAIRRPPAAPERTIKRGGYGLIVPASLAARSGERRILGLKIEPMPQEAAALLVVVRNMPYWLTLSKGSTLGNEIWFMPAHLAADLEIELGAGAEGAANLTLQLATIDGRILAETGLTIAASRAPAPSKAPMMVKPAEIGEQGLMRLLARGELLIDTGEVEAARTLLRTAAEAGSVAAALKLAETYDPGEVQRLGMAVAAADPLQAARWYERAEALGSQLASTRLTALGRR